MKHTIINNFRQFKTLRDILEAHCYKLLYK